MSQGSGWQIEQSRSAALLPVELSRNSLQRKAVDGECTQKFARDSIDLKKATANRRPEKMSVFW